MSRFHRTSAAAIRGEPQQQQIIIFFPNRSGRPLQRPAVNGQGKREANYRLIGVADQPDMAPQLRRQIRVLGRADLWREKFRTAAHGPPMEGRKVARFRAS